MKNSERLGIIEDIFFDGERGETFLMDYLHYYALIFEKDSMLAKVSELVDCEDKNDKKERVEKLWNERDKRSSYSASFNVKHLMNLLKVINENDVNEHGIKVVKIILTNDGLLTLKTRLGMAFLGDISMKGYEQVDYENNLDEKCQKCKGTGYIQVSSGIPCDYDRETFEEPCPNCNEKMEVKKNEQEKRNLIKNLNLERNIK